MSCKSWQSGFPVKALLNEIENNKKRSGRETWKSFRELVKPKWANALQDCVFHKTGVRNFTQLIIVTHLIGDKCEWENSQLFTAQLNGNSLKIVTLREMLIYLSTNTSTTQSSSEIGRILQLFKAANIDII